MQAIHDGHRKSLVSYSQKFVYSEMFFLVANAKISPTEQFNNYEVFTDDNNIFSTSKLPLQALLSITNQFIQDNTYTFLKIRPWGPIYKKGPYNTEC